MAATAAARSDQRTPLNIQHLPSDVLGDVLEALLAINPPLGRGPGPIAFIADDPVRLCTVQALRLTCRLFNALASPHLVPTLRVSLSQASLDRAAALSRIPGIAAGVRAVQVILGYRPAETATEVVRGRYRRLNELEARARQQIRESGGSELEPEINPEAVNLSELAAADIVHQLDHHIVQNNSWRAYLDDAYPQRHTTRKRTPEENAADAHPDLLEGIQSYRELQEEQQRLVVESIFVRDLAAAMARMPRARSLAFLSHPPPRHHQKPDLEGLRALSDKKRLRALLTAPSHWQFIEDLRVPGGVELVPARILSELPIAVHRAVESTTGGGQHLREMFVGCFPFVRKFDAIRPRDAQIPARMLGWDELRTACRHLETFSFGEGHDLSSCSQTIMGPSMKKEDRTCFDDFLRASLSSADLRDLTLALYPFADQYREARLRKDFHDLNKVLPVVRCPRAKRMAIRNAVVDASILESLCGQLRKDCLEYIELNSINLRRGSWAPSLDILRNRAASRCQQGRCEVLLWALMGAGFNGAEFDGAEWDDLVVSQADGEEAPTGEPSLSDSSDQSQAWGEGSSSGDSETSEVVEDRSSLTMEAEKYVSGEMGGPNPLSRFDLRRG